MFLYMTNLTQLVIVIKENPDILFNNLEKQVDRE